MISFSYGVVFSRSFFVICLLLILGHSLQNMSPTSFVFSTVLAIWHLVGLHLHSISVRATDSPIIGILSLPCYVEPHNCAPEQVDFNATTYIPASYVKWLEGGGARVVPLLSDADHNDVQKLLSTLNGVLFTGGAATLNSSVSFYYSQVNNILNYLRKYSTSSSSKEKKAIPLWATCLGFESLLTATSKAGVSILGSFDAEDLALRINFTSNAYNNSRMFNSFMDESYSSDVYNKLQIYNLTMNNHIKGIKPSSYYSDPYLNGNFSLLGLSNDRENLQFISLVESKSEFNLYWYASQFHPEKPQYELNGKDKHIPHDLNAIYANQYFVEFFVNECRLRNNNTMSESYYVNNVIYNYNPYYINQNDTRSYEQVYVFPKP